MKAARSAAREIELEPGKWPKRRKAQLQEPQGPRSSEPRSVGTSVSSIERSQATERLRTFEIEGIRSFAQLGGQLSLQLDELGAELGQRRVVVEQAAEAAQHFADRILAFAERCARASGRVASSTFSSHASPGRSEASARISSVTRSLPLANASCAPLAPSKRIRTATTAPRSKPPPT